MTVTMKNLLTSYKIEEVFPSNDKIFFSECIYSKNEKEIKVNADHIDNIRHM